MKIFGGHACILSVVLAALPSALGQQVLSSTPAQTQRVHHEGAEAVWSYALPEASLQTPGISAAALSPDGRCVAIAGSGQVVVLDVKGQKLWSWEYGKVNKFITAGGLAVSPACDEIALVGDSSYKYTWITNRHGSKVAIHTTSTPMGIAFSHDGQRIVLGTGGGDLLLLSKSGAVQWKKAYRDGPGLFGALSFAPGDKFIMLQGWSTGLIALDGTPVWMGFGWGMAAARDSRTFAVWSAPNHGPQVGSVSVTSADGKELWSRVAPGEPAAISASGDKIAAPVYEEADIKPADWDKYQDQPIEIQVFSRTGKVLKTVPVEAQEVLAMSPKGDRLLVRAPNFIQELDLDGNVLLKIPDMNSQVFVPDDFSGVLVWRRPAPSEVGWFTLK